MFVLLLLISWSRYTASQDDSNDLALIFKWNVVDYEWPTSESRRQFLDQSAYVPRNCYIRDIKIWQQTAYVTLPRWKPGVPATLARFPLNLTSPPTSPLLQPYPSWSMQTLDDCFSLQSVHSIDVDANGQLWVLDAGLVEEFGTNRTVCPPKVVVFDLRTDYVVKHETIPPGALRTGSVLTAMALDSQRQQLFIADSNSVSSGFVVYNVSAGTFQRFACEQLSPDDGSSNVDQVPSAILPEFVSIALNANRDRLYFSTADSDDLLYANTSAFASGNDLTDLIADLGPTGRSTKLVADSKGYMYFNLINQKSVAQWHEASRMRQSPRVIVSSKLLGHWISSLYVDHEGWLWIVSSRFRDYANDRFQAQKNNMRVFRTSVPRPEKQRRPGSGFNTEYVVLILFIVIIGLIIIEIWMFNSD